jgi:hypothetical protein
MMPVLTEPHGYWLTCFTNVASVTFTGNAVDTLSRLLQISFWPGAPKGAFRFED